MVAPCSKLAPAPTTSRRRCSWVFEGALGNSGPAAGGLRYRSRFQTAAAQGQFMKRKGWGGDGLVPAPFILKTAVQPQMNTDGHGFAAYCRATPPHPQGERLRRGRLSVHLCLSVVSALQLPFLGSNHVMECAIEHTWRRLPSAATALRRGNRLGLETEGGFALERGDVGGAAVVELQRLVTGGR